MTEILRFCFKKDLSTCVTLYCETFQWYGDNTPITILPIRGKCFESQDNLFEAIKKHFKLKKISEEDFFLIDEYGKITEQSLYQLMNDIDSIPTDHKDDENKELPVQIISEDDIPLVPVSKVKPTKTKTKSKNTTSRKKSTPPSVSLQPLSQPPLPLQQSSVIIKTQPAVPKPQVLLQSTENELKHNKCVESAVKSSEMENNIPSDPSKIKLIEKMDAPFRVKSWLTKEEVFRENKKWNSVATLFTFFYYIHNQLKWPLEECRVTASYDYGSMIFSTVIEKVYKELGIFDKFKESSSIVKLVVWCIASMNNYGLVRHILFVGSTSTSSRLSSLCCNKQKHNNMLYYITWPFRTDNRRIYYYFNHNKIRSLEIKDFLDDLFILNYDDILKHIPKWLYGLVRNGKE